jgi:ribonuclease-3
MSAVDDYAADNADKTFARDHQTSEPCEKCRARLHALEALLQYEFDHAELLLKALTHSSYANENSRAGLRHNERVEFLGDAVLDLILADHLFHRFRDRSEGDLSLMRSWLASEVSLADVAQSIDLGLFLFLGVGEEASGGRARPALLADALEAVIGAVFLDRGFAAAQAVVLRLFKDKLEVVDEDKHRVNYKNMLQTRLAAKSRNDLEYRVTNVDGPEHMKRFAVEVWSNGVCLGCGMGASKKEAEMTAACAALATLDENDT